MNRLFRRLALVALALASLGLGVALSSATSGSSAEPASYGTSQPTHLAAIAPLVLAETASGTYTSFIVVLSEQADVSAAASLPTKAEKGQFVYETLRQTALSSQASLRAELDRTGIHYRSFYIVNMIELTGDRDLVLKLAARPDVSRIEANPQISNLQSSVSDTLYPLSLQAPTGIEWNIQKVNAPAAWGMGYAGQGVVVAGADTGYQWDHPALEAHYRGWTGITATHDYNWHDAIHDSVGNPCGNDSPFPCDDYGHGTHTMGTMVGDDGAGNQVGMAPGAQWIGCRNMASGWGTPARYTECFEFFLAPYPVGGSAITQGVPSLAPAVIGNSWSCPSSEGCSALTLQTVVNNVRAAGIEVVGAAQNYGPSCSSVSEPIGIYSSTFTVGATDSSDSIASFSSRGPVMADGSGRRKPDISAPGVSIRSSVPGGGYAVNQGTSMATPHVVGLFALLWSAAPALEGDLAATEAVITSTALHLTSTQTCGSDTTSSIPNNVYGWGRIDALAASQVVSASPSLRMVATAPAGPISATGPLTYTFFAFNPSQLAPNDNVTVTDQLPQGVIFKDASPGGIYSPTTQTVTWRAPTLTAQTGLTFTLAVTVTNVPSGTLIANYAYSARSAQVPRGVGALPVTTLIYAQPQAALQITATESADVVLPYESLTYTFIAANPSPTVDSTGVIVTDNLPSGVTFASVSAGGDYSPTLQRVTWLAPTLAAQTSRTFTIGVTVNDVPSGTLIVNSDYGARSDQATQMASGPPLTTSVSAWPYQYYLPLDLW
jgi:serine protease AprX